MPQQIGRLYNNSNIHPHHLMALIEFSRVVLDTGILLHNQIVS